MIKRLFPLFACLLAFHSLSAQNQTDTSGARAGLEIFKINEVDEVPRFPGCEDLSTIQEKTDCANKKLIEYASANVRYPKEARENGIEGKVIVNFVIDVDGFPFDPIIKRSPGYGFDEEMIKVIELMQDEGIIWIPGKKDGNPVRVEFNFSLGFYLN